MLPNQQLKDFFYFNKKERVFSILVIAIIGSSLILPRYFVSTSSILPLRQDKTLVLAIDTLQERRFRKPAFKRDAYNTAYQYERSTPKGFVDKELFPFDPNTITTDEWQRLGLNAKTSKTINNYVSKGGRFYKPEDLQKIWGLPEGFYERVKSFVRITAVQKSYSPSPEAKPASSPEQKLFVVDANEADTAAFIALPGIGSKLSARIISFREKLGGFYTVEQIGETYGLPDSTFQNIKGRLRVAGDNIRKININTATKDELKIHPYIRWNLANAIVEYRNQHGAYQRLEELKNIVLVDEETFQKIAHYLQL